LLALAAQSQDYNKLREKLIAVYSDTIRLDSLSIIPGTIEVFMGDKLLEQTDYAIDLGKALFIPGKQLIGKSLKIKYRTFSINFTEPYFHKDYKRLVRSDEIRGERYSVSNSPSIKGSYFSNNQLQKQGSISRGISFGNNQDVIVNSSLNLQMSGRLNNEFEIRAAITDDNIPIQPDGTSQQIQEFDKVFIQVFNERTSLTVGDFEITSAKGNFLRVKKKAQGALFSTKFKLSGDKGRNLQTSFGAAVSKGQYNRMFIMGVEGNQGPYKLLGANNENYIIILAGSEKVYIDGKLLERGLDNDYTIDYNLAEIIFTPNQLITKDKRITFEFEYSDKNYARFMLYSENEYSHEKGRFFVSFFSNQDSKNQPLQQELSDSQKELLAGIGDSLTQAVSSNIEEVEYQADWVLYKQIDTLVNGNLYSPVYKYSTHPDSARYRLGFSFVGAGNGNYDAAQSLANGKVYEWVAPNSLGQAMGSYQPVVLLVTPKKKQVLSFGGDYSPTKKSLVDFELALSNNDLNTFSKLNSDDNVGFALNLGARQNIFNLDDSKSGKIVARYQLLNKDFDAVENFRPVEFSRDWNLQEQNQAANEHILSLTIDLQKDNMGSVSVSSEMLQKKNLYKAFKNGVLINLRKQDYEMNLNSSLLNSDDDFNKSLFSRNKLELIKHMPYFKIGFGGENEFNQWKDIISDSLQANSFSYYSANAFIENSDSLPNKWRASYMLRKDLLPQNNALAGVSLGHDFKLLHKFISKRRQTIKTIFNYRKLQIIDTSLTEIKEENNINSRFELNFKWFKGAVSSSVFYEIGSGLELKKEYSFVEVSSGQGVYIWNDYNSDGVQQLDEFEQGVYQDTANYIRVFIPGKDYEKILSNQFNLSLMLRPYQVWKAEKGLRKLASNFSNQFVFRADRKNIPDNFWDNANPFFVNPSELGLKSVNSSVRNTFSFNKSKSKFGADYLVQNSTNKLLLVNGFDSRTYFMQGLRFRWKVMQDIVLNENFELGTKEYSSEVFASKNYKIESIKNELVLTWHAGLDWNIAFNYSVTQKANTLASEKTTEHKLGPDLNYKLLAKANLIAKLNLIAIDYNQENTNTAIAYEMLGGLNPGTNVTWELQYQQKLAGNLQLNLNYSGRKSEGNNTIHIGGVQLRAYF
jgi:hypothetical protein